MFPAMSIFYVVGLFVEKECPRISAVLLAISKLYFFSMVLEFLVTMVQYTPFPLVDRQINHFDLMLGFSNANWMHWTQTHHWAMKLSLFFYSSLIYELLWVPILLALILQWRSLDVMYIGCLISAIIGFMIYYFFPTTEPAHVVHGVKFLPVEYKVVTQFMQMHHHQKVTSDMGGLVGLPSFHVVWAIIMVYAVRHQKWLFYPLIVFNSLIILSTLTLGWHFLADVLAAIVLASFSIGFSECFCKVRDPKLLPVINVLNVRRVLLPFLPKI